MKQPDNLPGNVFFIAGEINNRFSQKIKHAFREAGIDITVEQFSILALLWYREGYNQQEIANSLNRDKTTVARVLDNMFNKNLLVRIPDSKDNRNNLVYLTRKGKELQAECVRITGEYYIRGLQNIEESELDLAIGILNRIYRNLE